VYILLPTEALRSLLDSFSFTATHYKAKTSSILRPCYVKISKVVWNSETSGSDILLYSIAIRTFILHIRWENINLN